MSIQSQIEQFIFHQSPIKQVRQYLKYLSQSSEIGLSASQQMIVIHIIEMNSLKTFGHLKLAYDYGSSKTQLILASCLKELHQNESTIMYQDLSISVQTQSLQQKLISIVSDMIQFDKSIIIDNVQNVYYQVKKRKKSSDMSGPDFRRGLQLIQKKLKSQGSHFANFLLFHQGSYLVRWIRAA